jgi:hypothetical protein
VPEKQQEPTQGLSLKRVPLGQSTGQSPSQSSSADFYKLNYFKKCLPILNKLEKYAANSCVIRESQLRLYIVNRSQLEFFFECKTSKSFDEVFKIIKWSLLYEEYPNLIEGIFRELESDSIFQTERQMAPRVLRIG